MKKRLYATEIWSYKGILKILWIEPVSVVVVLDQMETKMTLIINIIKRKLKFL